MRFPKTNVNILYSVSPKAAETEMCESLSSYMMRLSREHNITIGVLISKIVAPVLDSKYILNSSVNGGNRFYDGAKSLNSFDKNAAEFTRVLELLTGRADLRSTTLLEIKNLISSRSLLRSSLAWCPICLKTWGEDSVYYPLIWFFKDVNICIKHSCELQDICFSCGKGLPILHRKSLVGYCSYCSNWLGASKAKEMENDKALFKAQQLSELVANRTFLVSQYGKESISNALLRLINYCTNGNLAEFARLTNNSKVTLWDWVYGGRLPTLGKILDICFMFKMSLMEFLSMDFPLGFQLNVENEQKEEGKVIARRKINKSELKNKLETVLFKKNYLSLSEVAKILEYDRKVLMANFPDICRLIVKQHKEYCIQQKQNRDFELIRNIDKAVEHLYENEVYPSRREIEKFLGKPGLLHERGLREEWLKKISK